MGLYHVGSVDAQVRCEFAMRWTKEDRKAAMPSSRSITSTSTVSLSTSTMCYSMPEHIVCGIYHNPAEPQFTIKQTRPQQFVDDKSLGRMILAHQAPLGAGQDILNLWFLGYTELCFFRICKGVLRVCPRFAWNDLLALMAKLLRVVRHPTFALWPRRSQVVSG
jgi:hypothetical protein